MCAFLIPIYLGVIPSSRFLDLALISILTPLIPENLSGIIVCACLIPIYRAVIIISRTVITILMH